MKAKLIDLKSLKNLNILQSEVSLYFVKRRTEKKELQVKVYSVAVEDELVENLRRRVKNRIDKAKNTQSYAAFTSDDDQEIIYQKDAKETHWQQIWIPIAERKCEAVKKIDALKNVDLMVARFVTNQENINGQKKELFACKKLDQKITNLRLQKQALFFKSGKMSILAEGQSTISISAGIDFFVWEDKIFITEKKNFELVMNIQEGMERKSKALLSSSKLEKNFSNLKVLENAISENKIFLRRAAKAEDKKLYEEADFFDKLRALVKQYPDWKIQIIGDKIEITKENTSNVLYLLSDSKAETLIKKRMINVVVEAAD